MDFVMNGQWFFCTFKNICVNSDIQNMLGFT